MQNNTAVLFCNKIVRRKSQALRWQFAGAQSECQGAADAQNKKAICAFEVTHKHLGFSIKFHLNTVFSAKYYTQYWQMLSWRDGTTGSLPSFLKVLLLSFWPFFFFFFLWYFSESHWQVLLLQVMQRICTYPPPNSWEGIEEVLFYKVFVDICIL